MAVHCFYCQLHAAPDLELQNLSHDMPTVLDASKLSTEALNMSIDSLTKGLEFLRDELTVTRQEHENNGALGIRLNHLIEFEEAVAATVICLRVSS